MHHANVHHHDKYALLAENRIKKSIVYIHKLA